MNLQTGSMNPFTQPLPDDAVLAGIAWLYLITNAARLFTYVPQILAVWRCPDGARSIALLTWGSWTVSHVAALLYALLVVRDLPMACIAAINLAGCGAVTLIAVHRRRQWGRVVRPLSAIPARR